MATQYAPAPACITIISCKYENRHRQNLPLNSLKDKQQQQHEKNKHCAILPSRHCQSKAKYSRIWMQAMPFCPSNKLTFDHWTLKVMSESCVTWATSVPISVVPGLSVLNLGPMYATDRQTDIRQTSDRQTDVRQHHRFMPRLLWAGHNNSTG